MSQKLFGTALLILLLTVGTQGFAQEKDNKESLPLATSWAVFNLSQQAKAESGLATRRLAVLFIEPSEGWHTYAHNPGGLGKPTVLTASLGTTRLQVLYPAGVPTTDVLDPSALVNAYPGRTPLFMPLPDKAAGTIAARLELLLCSKDQCLPAKESLTYHLPSGNFPDARSQAWWPSLLSTSRPAPKTQVELTPIPATAAPAASATSWANLKPRYHRPELEVRGLFKAVLLGLLAGLILNFMPCVLPVISIKLSALMAGSTTIDTSRRRTKFREHNFFFALGILAYFLLLGAVLGITGLAWGQIFQNSSVVLALTVVIFALALSLFGVFSLPVVDLKFDQMTSHPRLQALFTGLLVTLLATPCSGPFLGGVLGWTLLQPPWIISSVLVAVGAGMALPYLVLALFPDLVRLFPKPGPWCGHLEKIVGLLLMGTCIYLLSILPGTKIMSALILLWLTAMAVWIWGVARPGFDSARGILFKLLAVALIAAGTLITLRPVPVVAHIAPYSEASLRSMLGRETIVVDFTADWCPTCKALEQTTLTPARLGDMKARYGLELMKADLTEKNPEAEALLYALGSQSIPVLAIFPKNAPDKPLVLRDLFTPTQLEDALKQTTRP